MSNTTIDVRTQKDIQKSAVSRDKFPVDFGRAWKWIGYSRKDIAKDALLRQFADSVDFKSFPVETGNRGRRRGFINSYRIADAKAILSSAEFAERTLLHAGFMSGFQSKAAFNRVFKEHTGMTPGQYRAFAQKESESSP